MAIPVITPRFTMPRAKSTMSSASKATSQKSSLYMSRTQYKATIQGLRDQGLDHTDAVETLKVGIREANGKPVPLSLAAA